MPPTLPPLTPYDVFLTDVFKYILVASQGAAIWDYVILSSTEYRLIWRKKFTLISFAYVIARHAALVAIPISLYDVLGQPSNCQAMLQLLVALHALSQSATAFIFYQRILAIFEKSRVIFWVSGIFWIRLTINWFVTVPFAQAYKIPVGALPTPYAPWCAPARAPNWIVSSFITTMAFDISIFTATIVQAFRTGQIQVWRQGDQLTKTFYRSGMLFFLLASILNAMQAGFILQTQEPILGHVMSPIASLFNLVAPERVVLELKEENERQQKEKASRHSSPSSSCGVLTNNNRFVTRSSQRGSLYKSEDVDVMPLAPAAVRDHPRDLDIEQGTDGIDIKVHREIQQTIN